MRVARLILRRARSDWSNDGTRLVVVVNGTQAGTGGRAEIVPVGGGDAVEIRCEPAGGASCPDPDSLGAFEWTWSPDDQVLIGSRDIEGSASQYLLADPRTGLITVTDWAGTGSPAWQRANP